MGQTISIKTSLRIRRKAKMALHAFSLVLLLLGEISTAQSFDTGSSIVNFDDRRSVALARITNITVAPTNEQEQAARERIITINNDFADEFARGIEIVGDAFDRSLWFYQSLSESQARETLEESYDSADFTAIEAGYEAALIEIISNSVGEIFLDGKVRIDQILFDEYISMLPAEVRTTAQSEFARLISAHPGLPGTLPDTENPELDPTTLKATIAAVVARRLAATRIGQRLLAGLGRRLLNNAVGRGAIAVFAPGGEICGPAVILCEAGLFTLVVGWEALRNRNNVVETVEAALAQQASDLRAEVQSRGAIDETWAVIEVEANSLLIEYRGAVEDIMRDTFDNVLRQNADFTEGNLPQSMDEDTRAHVFREMASTFGDGFLEFGWADRYSYMSAFGDRARQLLDSHGSELLNLYLSRPAMVVRVVRAGASDSLISEILRSENSLIALRGIEEAIRRTGQLTPPTDAVLVDLLRFELPILPEEIEPHGIRIAASNTARLRALVGENPSVGALLYAQVLQGATSAEALDYALLSSNPSQVVEVFAGLPVSTVSQLIRSQDAVQLSSFISSFPVPEAVRLLSSSEAIAYVIIFLHRSGGPDAVRAWDELVAEYERPPLPWMQEQFLWIADLGYEPSSVSIQMINTAYDSGGQPDLLRRFWVWWAFVTGWPWGSFLLAVLVALLAAGFAPKIVRRFTRQSDPTRAPEQQDTRAASAARLTGESAKEASVHKERTSRNAGSSSDVQDEESSAIEEDKQADSDHDKRPTGATRGA